MNIAVLISFLICLSDGQNLSDKKSVPKYEDYTVSKIFSGNPASPKINNPQSRLFRSVIRQEASKGPNFAGHYTIAKWGCGSDCKAIAIVDAITGKIYFIPGITYVLRVPFQAEDPLQFQLDSRLVIIVGARNGEPIARKYYYEWIKNRLRLVRVSEQYKKNSYPF